MAVRVLAFAVKMLVLCVARVTPGIAGSDFAVGALRKWRKEESRLLLGSKRRIVWYRVGAPHRVQRGGYWLDACRLTFRNGR